MIPPCDPVILENNPQFKRLYQHLTTTLLNPDGSTRAHDAQPARKALREEVRDCQIRAAKKQIKQHALRRLAFDPDSGLPDDCRDPVAIVSLYLESCPDLLALNDGSHEAADTSVLLAPDIDLFYSNMPLLVAPLSEILSTALSDVRAIANAGTSPAGSTSIDRPRPRARTRQAVARSIAQVPVAAQLEDRLRALRQKQLIEIPTARTQMATIAAEVLATRAAVLERTVMLLERAKHGAVARATKARAEHLATVAQGVEGKLSVMELEILATIHTPEVVAALGRYYRHLRDTRERLEEQRALALEELKGYEEVDTGGGGSSRATRAQQSAPMKEIARRYGSLIRDIEDVRMEIERLSFSHTSNLQATTNYLKSKMADEALSIYDEIEIEDMTFDPNLQSYHYPCPCGDRFEIAIDDLRDGEDIAVCPSCSLMIRVIFDQADLAKDDDDKTGSAAVAVQA
ncbi:zf-CSL-domain-containing protein [Aspergillus heteromorphus CBS 117.55]|uniref:Diphthamide biosynthesis protein 3 n=1 Tax=Aspergillus heteromorphus CBS 117.55 TaxID=1448321 RepID=A0A317WNW1_9EURO|nr:zf-CSL-domain-containing protein [Aspergillus heteromorphus CBS 117.55]PWY87675.1 zf-CSL-domain-containing protein [Aspergillus heteromorphus CBS 117.55]